MAELGRIVGKAALWEGAKALLKTAAIGAALWIVVALLLAMVFTAVFGASIWIVNAYQLAVVATLLPIAAVNDSSAMPSQPSRISSAVFSGLRQ